MNWQQMAAGFSPRRRSGRKDRRTAAREREKAEAEALKKKVVALRLQSPPPAPRPKAPERKRPRPETPEQRAVNDQLRSRGGVIHIDTGNIEYRLHAEKMTPSALLSRHFKESHEGKVPKGRHAQESGRGVGEGGGAGGGGR